MWPYGSVGLTFRCHGRETHFGVDGDEVVERGEIAADDTLPGGAELCGGVSAEGAFAGSWVGQGETNHDGVQWDHTIDQAGLADPDLMKLPSAGSL